MDNVIVQFLQDFGDYPARSRVTFSRAMAEELIARGVAEPAPVIAPPPAAPAPESGLVCICFTKIWTLKGAPFFYPADCAGFPPAVAREIMRLGAGRLATEADLQEFYRADRGLAKKTGP